MATIEGWVYFDRVIDDTATVHAVFGLASDVGWSLERIGSFDPLRKPFTDVGVLEELAEALGRNTPCGSFYAKSSRPRARVELSYCRPRVPGSGAVNWVLYEWSGPALGGGEAVEHMVNAAFGIPGAAYASVTTEDRRNAQHVTGTVNQRLPGIFYMNVFGSPYLELLGDRLMACEWARSEAAPGRFTGWLFASLDDTLDASTSAAREAAVKECLGWQFFDGSADMPQLARG